MASFVNNYHPEYNEKIKDWGFFQQSYDGGREYVTADNIFRHSREDDIDYENRLNRAVYFNHCQPIVDLFTGFIYGGEQRIGRPDNDTDYLAFLDDVDFQHSSIDDKMKEVATQAQIKGHVGVLVDMPRPDVRIISLADRQQQNLRPYLNLYHAEDITNWAVDRFGQFKWVRLRSMERLDDDPFSQRYDSRAFYTTWTRSEWVTHDDQGQLIPERSGEHNLGVVPFVSCRFRKKTMMLGQSQLKDISRINRMLVNMVSCIDEFSMKQAFPFLAAPHNIEEASAEDLTIGQTSIYEYPEGGKAPEYVSPSTETATFLQGFTHYLVTEILRHANLESRVLMEQSGLAKLVDFQQTNAVLGAFARGLEHTENQINRIRAAWLETTPIEDVDYPDSFDVENLDTLLDNQEKINALYFEQSPTLIAETLKRLRARLLPKLEADMQGVIDGELDDRAVAESQAAAMNDELRRAA